MPLDLKKSFTKRLYGFGALNFCGGFFGGGGSAPERPEHFCLFHFLSNSIMVERVCELFVLYYQHTNIFLVSHIMMHSLLSLQVYYDYSSNFNGLGVAGGGGGP